MLEKTKRKKKIHVKKKNNNNRKQNRTPTIIPGLKIFKSFGLW